MSLELSLRFPEINQLVIKLEELETDYLDFISPLSEDELQEIRWYLEVYSTSYTTDLDDERAKYVRKKIPKWGEAIFDAVFNVRAAQRIFNEFQDSAERGRLLTISANQPEILSLPWELLRDPEGTYLFHEKPRISIRRKLAKAGGGRRPFQVKPKESIRLLFVVSRPKDAAFIDPRSEPMTVMNVLEREASGRIVFEFLRPATLDKLVERLEDKSQPVVDIIHFDGHGIFDKNGSIYQNEKKINPIIESKSLEQVGGKTGYLLFEDQDGKQKPIAAETLGSMLHHQEIGLIVLSACQSATIAGEEAMGSVAARLCHSGIPSVLAMTYTVLVETTRQLFEEFYRRLAQGDMIGESLDNARRKLYLYQERGERQRDGKRIILKLEDWFLPAIYQSGKDISLLLSKNSIPFIDSQNTGNLPKPEEKHGQVKFYGRSREIWEIERALTVQGTRRVTISGFGGQGKTRLAIEAANWFCRVGIFKQVCFIDFSLFQSMDAVEISLSILGEVLEESIVDENTAAEILANRSILILLDNLEVVDPKPLYELLTVAKIWSEIGNSRVILTTRQSSFEHPDYPTQGSWKHISLSLDGLLQHDAFAYFNALFNLPPTPILNKPSETKLIELFRLIGFHPFSIQILAQELREKRLSALGERLETLVDEYDDPLLASLNLSLERLSDDLRRDLLKIAVFKGGATESILLAVTSFGIEKWSEICSILEKVGLVERESLLGIQGKFIKFHPNLSPALWNHTELELRESLLVRYRICYKEFINKLCKKEKYSPQSKSSILSLVRKEIPNLLASIRLDLSDATTVHTEAVRAFIQDLSNFLFRLGLQKDLDSLSEQYSSALSSFPSNFGLFEYRFENLLQTLRSKDIQQAAQEFEDFVLDVHKYYDTKRLKSLGKVDVFQNTGINLFNLGYLELAVNCFEEALKCLENLIDDHETFFNEVFIKDFIIGDNVDYEYASLMLGEEHFGELIGSPILDSQDSKGQTMTLGQAYQIMVNGKIISLQMSLGMALCDLNRLEGARKAFKTAQEVAKKDEDVHSEAIALLELGNVELGLGHFQEAGRLANESLFLNIDKQIFDLALQSQAYFVVGISFFEVGEFEKAELSFRRSGRFSEECGRKDLTAKVWHELGILSWKAGKLNAAEGWFRKSIELKKEFPNPLMRLTSLRCLVSVLTAIEGRLDDAIGAAEETLNILKPHIHHPNYLEEALFIINLLVKTSEEQNRLDIVRKYKSLGRDTFLAAVRDQEFDLPMEINSLFDDIVAVIKGELTFVELESMIEDWAFKKSKNLGTAINKVISGERNYDVLCEQLNLHECLVVVYLLKKIDES